MFILSVTAYRNVQRLILLAINFSPGEKLLFITIVSILTLSIYSAGMSDIL